MFAKAAVLLACLTIVSSSVLSPRVLSKSTPEVTYGEAPRGTAEYGSLANLQLDNGQTLQFDISPMREGGKEVQRKYAVSVSGEFKADKAPTSETIGNIVGKAFQISFPINAITPLMTIIKAGKGSITFYVSTQPLVLKKAVSSNLENVGQLQKDKITAKNTVDKAPVQLILPEQQKDIVLDFEPLHKGHPYMQPKKDMAPLQLIPTGEQKDIVVDLEPVHKGHPWIQPKKDMAPVQLIPTGEQKDIVVDLEPVHKGHPWIQPKVDKEPLQLIPTGEQKDIVVDLEPVHKGHPWIQPKQDMAPLQLIQNDVEPNELADKGVVQKNGPGKFIPQQVEGGVQTGDGTADLQNQGPNSKGTFFNKPLVGHQFLAKVAGSQLNLKPVSPEQLEKTRKKAATRTDFTRQRSIEKLIY